MIDLYQDTGTSPNAQGSAFVTMPCFNIQFVGFSCMLQYVETTHQLQNTELVEWDGY